MDRYQLAKLVDWAGTLRTRKGMQKIVFLLQSAGCPLGAADYILHHYGPYSSDLAQLTDEMTRSGLLIEEQVGNAAGKQFNYKLADETRKQIASHEATPQGKAAAAAIAPYEQMAKELVAIDVRELELASTVAYFRRQSLPWPTAVEKACDFKRVPADNPLMVRAVSLAKQVEKK